MEIFQASVIFLVMEMFKLIFQRMDISQGAVISGDRDIPGETDISGETDIPIDGMLQVKEIFQLSAVTEGRLEPARRYLH